MSAQKREEIAAAEKFSRVFFANSKENLILDRNIRSLERGQKAVVSTISTNQKILCRRFQQKVTQTRLASARAQRGLRDSNQPHADGSATPVSVSSENYTINNINGSVSHMAPEDIILSKIWKTGSQAFRNSMTPLSLPGRAAGRKLPALKSPLPKVTGSSENDSSRITPTTTISDGNGASTSNETAHTDSARSSNIQPHVQRPSTAGRTSINVRLTMSAKTAKKAMTQLERQKPVERTPRKIDDFKPAKKQAPLTKVQPAPVKGLKQETGAAVITASDKQPQAEHQVNKEKVVISKQNKKDRVKGVKSHQESFEVATEQAESMKDNATLDKSRVKSAKSVTFTTPTPRKAPPTFGHGLNKAINKREKVNNFGISLSPAVPKTNRAVHNKEENFVIRLFKRKFKKSLRANRLAAQKEEEEKDVHDGGQVTVENRPGTHHPDDKAVLTVRPRTAHELGLSSSGPPTEATGPKEPTSIVKESPPLPPPLSSELAKLGMGDPSSNNNGKVITPLASPYVRPHNNQFMLGSPPPPQTPTSTSRPKSRSLYESHRERVRSAHYEMRIRDFCNGLDPYKFDRERQIKDYYFVRLLPKQGATQATSIVSMRCGSALSSRHSSLSNEMCSTINLSENHTETGTGGKTVQPSESELKRYGGDTNIRNMTFKVLNWEFSKAGRGTRRVTPSHGDPTNCR